MELTNLQDLNLCYTTVEDVEILKQMTWLKRLWIAGCGLNTPQYESLLASMPETQVVLHITEATGGGWRDHQNYRDMRDLLGMAYME